MKLNADGTGIDNNSEGKDTASYFRGLGRFRDLSISPDGLKFYLACDASGRTSGPTGGFNGGGTPPPNAGTIQEFSYTGIILPINETDPLRPDFVEKKISVFPNPASRNLTVSVRVSVAKPYTVKLYNMSGVLVKSVKSTKTEVSVDIENLQTGMYFVQVVNVYDQVLDTEKIIKL
jgi:hypothetical protein